MNAALTDFETGRRVSESKIRSPNLLTDYFVGEVTFLVWGPSWKGGFLEQQSYLFDEYLRNIDDWDFNLRMLYANPKLILLEGILIYYRMHPNSFSKEVRRLNQVEIAFDFAARDKPLILIQNRNDIDLYKIKQFLLYSYKRYIKWVISKQADRHIFTFLFKALFKK